MNSKKIALIPAYEPDGLLIYLTGDLTKAGFEIVVVDDGSGPDYGNVFAAASRNATVLTHPVNQGKGHALKTGLSYIREHFGSNCVIVTVDADGQHKVSDALKLCEIAEMHRDTLVLGSRKLRGDIPLRSRFGNTVTRLIYRLTTGVSVYDTQTGLRAFHASLVPQLLEIQGERYEYEMNMILEFAREGVPIREEEIETIYLDDNAASHFDTIRDSLRVYREILKFSASSLAGFLTDYAMYSLLLLITGNLAASNIGARIVSGTVNYTLNRKFVFQSSVKTLHSAIRYIMLAAVILAGNTLVLTSLVTGTGMGRMAAKLVTEILFFLLSWSAQKFLVFGKPVSKENPYGKNPYKTNTYKEVLNYE